MKKLGILLPHLGASQAAFYAINTANYLFGRTDIDICLFYQELFQPCSKPLCATFSATELWSFRGIIISTNINTTLLSINAISPQRKLFYIWDLEWTRAGKQNFEYNIAAYRNPSIELITRCPEHADVVQNYANRQVHAIIPDFNINFILDYVERTNATIK